MIKFFSIVLQLITGNKMKVIKTIIITLMISTSVQANIFDDAEKWIDGAYDSVGDFITLDCLVSKVCCCVFYCTTNPITNIT
jgi:hypothetical protein